MDLIVIEKRTVGNEEINSVDARDLHSRLGLKSEFANWIKQNIKKLNLVENIDYATVDKIVSGGKFAAIEYILTLDAGKHIAMMTNTETAHSIRTYFIEYEKQAKALPVIHDPQTRALMMLLADNDAMKHAQHTLSIQQQVISTGLTETRNEVAKLSAQITTRTENFCTVAGYCKLNGHSMTSNELSGMGKICRKLSDKAGIPIRDIFDPRWGKVGLYHFDILHSAFAPKN